MYCVFSRFLPFNVSYLINPFLILRFHIFALRRGCALIGNVTRRAAMLNFRVRVTEMRERKADSYHNILNIFALGNSPSRSPVLSDVFTAILHTICYYLTTSFLRFYHASTLLFILRLFHITSPDFHHSLCFLFISSFSQDWP